MLFCKTLVLLGSAAATFAAPATGARKCLNPQPDANFVANEFDGDWYVALHLGQVPKCLKFHISHNLATKTATIEEVLLTGTPSHVTMEVKGANTAVGPGMYTEGIKVTNVFLGSDKYQNWAAFYQCVEGKNGGHLADFLIVYKKQKTISEEKLTEAKEVVGEALQNGQVSPAMASQLVRRLTEPRCTEDQLP